VTISPLSRAVRRLRGVAAGFGLTLLTVTCTETTVTGPERAAVARLNFSSLAAPVGGAPVRVDSLEIELQRAADGSVALDTVVGFSSAATTGDSAVVRLLVHLRQSPEDFLLSVRAFGGGMTWYTATASVRLSASSAAAPTALTVQYVGPGANAVRIAIAPTDTTVVGGIPFPLHASVYDAAGKPISGVPVGYRVSDTSGASVVYLTPYTALFTGKPALRDSVWVVAETPTHLKDSTQVHIVPPAAALLKKSGDLQASVINVPLPAPLIVRVLDALNGGFKGATVQWTVTAGSATLTAPFSVSDDTGYAVMAVTPTAITTPGGLAVQAVVGGLQGSPVTFTATAIAGTIQTVTVTPKVDTIANGATLQYTAIAKDAVGNVVNTTFGWTSTAPSIATVTATTGQATALAGDSTRIIATAGGVADTAWLYVRALKTLTLSPADTVITALGDVIQLRYSALDNFGAPITSGLNIRYLTATPNLAEVDPLSGLVTVTGPGKAVILARDAVATSDSLVIGSATLQVNQVVAGVVNTPRGDTLLPVGVLGQSQIVARAFDRNGYTVPNTTFGWTSRDLRFATVSPTGVVTGVALGAAYVVDSVGDLKDSTHVSVVAAPGSALVTMVAPTSFSPASVTIGSGQSVTWQNNDDVNHTTTSATGVWDSGTMTPGQTYTVYFPTPGVYLYHCAIHGALFMSGTIIVQ